jgi:hypothetical protein
VELIDEAHRNGARLFMACRELGITIRTRQRWLRGRDESLVKEDGRKDAERRKPAGALNDHERREVLQIADSPEYASRAPAQIVADLADKGQWPASESTFYRILRENNQQHARGKAKGPNRKAPASHGATAPDQVWTWDITYLTSPVRGKYYYLYMIVDIFSRYIVGWEIHEEESGECAKTLIGDPESIPQRGALEERKTPGAPLRQRKPHEGIDLQGHTGETGHIRVVQQAEDKRRQRLLGVPLPDPEISPGIPDLRI